MTIEKALGKKLIRLLHLLTFDKVRYVELTAQTLPVQYVQVFESYLNYSLFRIRLRDEYPNLVEIEAGVPQESVLATTLYLLCTNEIMEMSIAPMTLHF